MRTSVVCCWVVGGEHDTGFAVREYLDMSFMAMETLLLGVLCWFGFVLREYGFVSYYSSVVGGEG